MAIALLQSLGINGYILFIAMIGFFIGIIMLVWVNKTVGLKYAYQLFQMKRKKGKVLLKIFMPNGKPQYQVKDVANLIEYTYKENGEEKQAMVKFDYYSMYRDFSDIPVIECDPYDIVPRNPFIGSNLSISPQVIKKNLIDSSKTDFEDQRIKKWIKWALPITAVVIVGFLIYSGNQDQLLQQCLAQVGGIPRTAEIVATG